MNEVNNAETTRKHFASNPYIYIPKIHKKWCSSRVITMEYVEGIKIDDIDTLKHHFSLRKIGETLVQAFAKMIFIDGHVHCDAHPGNVMVRKHPTASGFQIILLDHGFYAHLDASFKSHLTHLWFSMSTFDNEQT